jgi:diguanylate cyclase (GGDEF)-like protein
VAEISRVNICEGVGGKVAQQSGRQWLRLGGHRPAFVATMVGLALSLAAAYVIGRWESQARDIEFSGLAKSQAIILQDGVNEYLARLTALRTYFESANEEITRNEFDALTARRFEHGDDVRRIEWVPRVIRIDRARFEQRARATGLAEFSIRSIDSDRVPTFAPDTDEYFPIYYSTDSTASAAYGTDYASDGNIRATLERARDNDIMTLSAAATSLKSTDGANDLLVAVPVYVKGAARDTIADRRRNIAGFVVGTFDVPHLLDTILSNPASTSGVELNVHVPGADQTRSTVYRFDRTGSKTWPNTAPTAAAADAHWTGTLRVADAVWELSASPAGPHGILTNYGHAMVMFVAGVAITAVFVGYIFFASNHSRQLELANRRVRDLAQMDVLTGLANRSHFMTRMETARRVLADEGAPFSVFMLDLDRFKEVNDMLGHAAGDLLLQQVTRRLQAATSKFDVLARLGGDEFAILQTAPEFDAGQTETDQNQRERAQLLAMRILDILNEPIEIEGQAIFVSTSIGISLSPRDGVDSRELLKKADLALYQSKSTGRNGFSFFDPEMTVVAAARHGLKNDLRLGLERGEFELAYQPFVEADTRRVVGAEALLRWRHPIHGLMLPSRFIPIAEESGLITPIGEWVIHQACQDASRWPPHVKIAVNLSAVQFRKCNLLDVILCALVDSGLSPERLEVEVTETVLLEREMDYVTLLHQLKNIGVSVALDDFGIGYSSLSYLKQFPFDKIKIDRSFTKDVAGRADSAAIVSSITALGRSLGIVTIAEGVETEDQFEIVKAAGVTLAQGYLFGKGRPASELDFSENPVRRTGQANHAGKAA